MKTYGLYTVGFASELNLSSINSFYYVINNKTNRVVGSYYMEDLAIALAKSLNGRDERLLTEEIENILLSNE